MKELEKELSAAQLEAKAFKTLVEVAESLGMPVRKKAVREGTIRRTARSQGVQDISRGG